MGGADMRGGQAGLSLVELMVALLLSGLLILGVVQMYLDLQRHYQFQQAQLVNLEGASFAALIIERLVAHAGYRSRPQEQIPEEAFPALAAGMGCPAFAAGQSLALVQTDGRAELCIRYQRGLEPNEADCTGTLLEPSDAPVNVLARLTLDAGKGELRCAAYVDGASVGAASILAQGLVEYSLQPIPGPASKVQFVGFHLLFASEANRLGGATSEVLADWLALTGRRPDIPDAQGRVLQIGVASIALRNLNP